MTWGRWALALLCAAACAHLLAEVDQLAVASGQRYDSVAAARTAGLFADGWIPDVLPAAAGPLVESHDLDSGARCARAVFPKAQRSALVHALLEYGYDLFRGEALPSQDTCPFPVNELRAPGERFRNSDGSSAFELFAFVGEDIVVLWSQSAP